MALTQRQMACFERNTQFLNEVAAALLPIAATLKKAAMVVNSNPESDPVARAFAAIHERVANQILSEQGIDLHTQTGFVMPNSGAVASGSTAMKYLVQQMLLQPAWTLTPDEWATDEAAARATIQAAMAGLITNLTAIPAQE